MQFLVTFESIMSLLIGIIIFVIIWAIQGLIGIGIKRKFIKSKYLPRDAINGILYFIQFLAALFILFGVLYMFGIFDQSSLLSLSAMISTALGFACAIAVGNLVAGFYIMISRPYNIGDFIKIAGSEGFVQEIGLNYTKLENPRTGIIYRIPNKVVMNENIVIFETTRIIETPKEKKRKWYGVFSVLGDLIDSEETIKYGISIEHSLNDDPKEVSDILQQLCIRWSKVFGYKPTLEYDYISARVKIRFIITANDMQVIQSNLNKFYDDLWHSLHEKKSEES